MTRHRPDRDSRSVEQAVLEFLPDAEEIEQRPVSPAACATLYALLAFIAAVILWASLSEIDRIVIARGRLVTSQSAIVVQPLEMSAVRTMDVVPGQVVHRGQRLAALDPTFVTADMAQLQGRLNSLSAQVRRLEAESADTAFAAGNSAEDRLQARLLAERQGYRDAKLRQLNESLARLRSSLATSQRDQNVLGQRLDALAEIENMRSQLLEKQSGSRLKLLESRDQRLALERELKLTIGRTEETGRQIAATEAEKAAFLRDWRQQVLDDLVKAQRDLAEAQEQLSKAQRRGQLVDLTAPVDGVVLEIAKRSTGSVVKEAEPLVTLVPLDSPLEAEVRLQAMDIGFVAPGNAAHIKVDAFPFQRHGTLEGNLRVISPDSFDRQQPSPAMAQGEEAYYVGRLDVGPAKLQHLPAHARLMPGMTVTAEIVVGRRTVISYFLYPIFRSLDEAIREP